MADTQLNLMQASGTCVEVPLLCCDSAVLLCSADGHRQAQHPAHHPLCELRADLALWHRARRLAEQRACAGAGWVFEGRAGRSVSVVCMCADWLVPTAGQQQQCGRQSISRSPRSPMSMCEYACRASRPRWRATTSRPAGQAATGCRQSAACCGRPRTLW
jgi:hypothetical protein